MPPRVTVIIPTHNPDRERLRRTLRGLSGQTLASDSWETLLVDNASSLTVGLEPFRTDAPANIRVVPEPTLGLTAARLRGLHEAAAPFAVFVDDDNVLAADYLENALAAFARIPEAGILGGKSIPEFESPPPAWTQEFHSLLALRDLGPTEIVSHGLRPDSARRNAYPLFAPIGAGMAIRREAWNAWLVAAEKSGLSDRRGGELTSSGDNDIVLAAMTAGWQVAYLPHLRLTHLIPAGRLEPSYLARLNRGIQKSWMQVLSRYDANPWPRLSPFGARLRSIRAWFTHRAWRRPVGPIRWQGACGHFEGRVASRSSRRPLPTASASGAPFRS